MAVRMVCAVAPMSLGRQLQQRLQGCDVTVVDAFEALRRHLDRQDADLVVISRRLAPDPGEGWVEAITALPERPEVVILHEDEEAVARATWQRVGCAAVLPQSLPVGELGRTLEAMLQRHRRRDARSRRVPRHRAPSLLDDGGSSSPIMQSFMRTVRRIVPSDSSLLILGETGSGKERLARAIHERSPRASGPFLAVNCGALPETLLDSELFGYEKGAFTGASRARRGYFEQADGGTILLDEIAEVPLHQQVRLLRVLEDGQVCRLGSERMVSIDVRVIAATNRNLQQEVEAGRFRSDLFYRLAVVTLAVPPLRERREDIPALLEGYLEHFSRILSRPVGGFTAQARMALVRYPWPGNIRELINVVERAVLLAPGTDIGLDDLPPAIGASPARQQAAQPLEPTPQAPAWCGKPLRQARRQAGEAFERDYLDGLLRAAAGRIGEAARLAGVSERSLYDLMQRHRLCKEAYRSKPAGGRRSAARKAKPQTAPARGQRPPDAVLS